MHLHVNDNICLKAEVVKGAGKEGGGPGGGLQFPWEHQLLGWRLGGDGGWGERLEHAELQA